MNIKRNAAVLMVSGRKEILQKTLSLFYENWNNYYKYPVYIYDMEMFILKMKLNFIVKFRQFNIC